MAQVEMRYVEPTLSTGESYRIPYWHIDSGRDGPCVLVTAALHRGELQGSEAVRRFKPVVEEDLLCGSCMLIPFANPEATRRRQPHIDFEVGRYYGRDSVNNVNCSWPGDPEGSSEQRLSNALFHAVVEPATKLIDLHCWQHITAATGLANSDRPDSIEAVNAAGPPFGRHGQWKPEVKERPVTPCTLTSCFHDTDRTAFCVELSGQNGFWPDQVELGLQILNNTFRHFGMLPGEPVKPEYPTVWLNDCEQMEVLAPASGVFVAAPLSPGDRVKQGDRLGHIVLMDSFDIVPIAAESNAVVFRFGNYKEQAAMPFHPYVEREEPLAVLVCPDQG